MIKFIQVGTHALAPLYSRYDIPLLGYRDEVIGVITTNEGQPIPMDVIERIKKEIQDGRINI